MPSPQQPHRRYSFSMLPSSSSQSSNRPRRSSIAGQQQQKPHLAQSPSQDHSPAQNIRPITPANWPLGRPLLTNPRQTDTDADDALVHHPPTANEAPGRTGTAFSEAVTLVRSNSARSRSSIAKHAPHDETRGSGDGTALRSIFPRYDPSVPLAEQHYAPVQIGPTQLPRAVISRQSVYEEPESAAPSRVTGSAHGHGTGAVMPTSLPPPVAVRGRWPPRIQAQPPPVVPTPCSAADLMSLWRVANGWKASASEGRVYCLKLTRQDDAPVYTLSSATAQPFWKLRLDPTSASAYVNLTRHDPSKPYKPPKTPPSRPNPSSSDSTSRATIRRSSSGDSSRSSSSSDPKHWHDALTTTLEPPSRKQPPQDGLLALLMPTAATKMAVQRAHDDAALEAASNECARLVWDQDSSTHYLVHNALAKPFCVTTDRHPAYSRVEYTLEHDESPAHLAKLTRDGTGAGWLELDTRVACQISACYILDVAVTALLLVAMADEHQHCHSARLGTFAPPPRSARDAQRGSWSWSWSWSGRRSVLRRGNGSTNTMKAKTNPKMEDFDMDVESQHDSLGKKKRRRSRWSRGEDQEDHEDQDKLPLLVRAVVKLTKGLFALVLWSLAVLFKCLSGVLKVLYKCVGSKY
ncbi:hypothetical protein E4U55_007118 [Claviceps digitariae]|nr:hypothetical protein E4U55_007118 [Claviceps digitariae]